MVAERQKAEGFNESAFVVILNPQKEVLLRRRKNQDPNQAWNIPGYKIFPPRDPKEFFVQMFRIETGLDLEFKRLFYAPEQKPGKVRTSYYLAELNNHTPSKFPDQSFEYRWFPVDQLDGLKFSRQVLAAIKAAPDVSDSVSHPELKAAS